MDNYLKMLDLMADANHKHYIMALLVLELGIDEGTAADYYAKYMESDVSLFDLKEFIGF